MGGAPFAREGRLFARDRFYRLDAPVHGVLEAWDVLHRNGRLPRRMVLLSVLADVVREDQRTDLRKLTFSFTRRARKDAVCQLDNVAGRLTCSAPYPSPPKPGGWEPLDPTVVRVDVREALAIADEAAGPRFADRGGPDLALDMLLKAVEGRPFWEVSYDVWLVEGPEAVASIRVDAVSGEIVERTVRPDERGAPDGTDRDGGQAADAS